MSRSRTRKHYRAIKQNHDKNDKAEAIDINIIIMAIAMSFAFMFGLLAGRARSVPCRRRR
ncbi:MAG: hypothetical protein LBL35_07875 [Clostridiales bacterium]|nr:hypothetical protein [Clostridiales bacterium]